MGNQAVDKTILIVDDDPRSVTLMNIVLGHAGYRVVSASNTEEGLAVLERERPDLVMVDLLMPGIDGFGFCRQARALPSQHRLPLVLFTAMANAETRRQGLRAGADDVLVKPFERHELLQRLEQLLAPSDDDASASASASTESAPPQ